MGLPPHNTPSPVVLMKSIGAAFLRPDALPGVNHMHGNSYFSSSVITSAISCPLWSPVYEYQKVECAFTSPLRTECDMFLMYCMQCCMSVSAVL